MRLAREQLDQYDEDGYVIVPNFLSAEEVGVHAADADIPEAPQRGLHEGNVYEKNSGLIRKSYSFDKDFDACADGCAHRHQPRRLPRVKALRIIASVGCPEIARNKPGDGFERWPGRSRRQA